jgi:hypothetical protein
MLEVSVWGQSETLLMGQGSHDFEISLRGTEGLSKEAYMHRDRKGSNTFTILFFSTIIQHYTGCHIPEEDSFYLLSCSAGDHVGHKLKMAGEITAYFNAF